MQKLVWKNAGGDEINLTAGSYGVTNWTGLSNADINLQTQQVPYQDGSVFIDALLNNRGLPAAPGSRCCCHSGSSFA